FELRGKKLGSEQNLRVMLNLEDISATKFTETALRESEQNYRTLAETIIENANALLASIVESSDDAIISKNLDGTITSWNKGAEIIFGYTSNEAVGKSITMLIPIHLIDEEKSIIEKIRKGGRIEHFETVRQHKNGSLLNISLSISPVKNKEGSIIGAAKIARDITEKHKAAEELQQSQLMLSLAMQSSRMGVWENDIVSGIVHWSKELEEIFGLEIGSFGGTRDAYYKFIHEEDRQRVSAEVQTAIAEKRDYTIEFRFKHSDGSMRWMEGRGKAVYSDKGEPIRVYGIGIDITDRKSSEATLRESEEKYRTLFNSIDEGFCIIEMLFDKNGKPCDYRFLDINPMFEKLTGIENAIGKTVLEKVPDIEPHWIEIYGKVAVTGQPIRFTEGSQALSRWFDVYATRIGGEESRRIALLFTNVTERKLIELEREEILKREIAARQTAEEANRAKDDFLSVLSHELRTPLNAILGWTRILNMDSLDAERRSKAVETIERNARLQKNLIEDLLDVSRIISDKMHIENVEVDFVSVVRSALETVSPFAETKNINIEFISEFESQKVVGDFTRLHQIIVNLANNAVKFTSNGGNVKLFLTVEDNKLCLKVADTGIGIAPEFLPFVFDRFRQADSTIIRNHSGLGLGLTIVRHLTELHGGKIFAESDGVNKGTTFTLELPLNNLEIEGSKPFTNNLEQNQPKIYLQGKTILLVDDERDSIEPIQLLLENRGATIVCVNSAREALQKITETRFDLLISDIGMSEIDGFNLLKMIRESDNIEYFPAIALTAYASTEDRRKTLASGFQQHLAKPIDFDILLKTVAAILLKNNDDHANQN
ncbi:MAG TPA: PAS domain S-box protein, partial [Pyrinomonadaceae bacterium]|nr:PAS domain S-box protein [Pyrinomonadaceae bacterium]